jgi:hypothetical protein
MIRRAPRRPLVLVALATLTVFILSGRYGVRYQRMPLLVFLGAGGVGVEFDYGPSGFPPPEGFQHFTQSPTYRLAPGLSLRAYGRYVFLPLWIPAGLLGALSAAPRRGPAGRCRYCGYDLTGNTTGVCPECGVRVQAQGESSQAIR